MRWATVEPDLMEHRAIWNLITLYVDGEGVESTEVTAYATKEQALDAKMAYLNSGWRPSDKPYKISKKTRGDVGILKKRK